MKVSQLIKILENVKEKVGDLPLYLPNGVDEIVRLTFSFECGNLAMEPHEDDDFESTISILREINREVVS